MLMFRAGPGRWADRIACHARSNPHHVPVLTSCAGRTQLQYWAKLAGRDKTGPAQFATRLTVLFNTASIHRPSQQPLHPSHLGPRSLLDDSQKDTL